MTFNWGVLCWHNGCVKLRKWVCDRPWSALSIFANDANFFLLPFFALQMLCYAAFFWFNEIRQRQSESVKIFVDGGTAGFDVRCISIAQRRRIDFFSPKDYPQRRGEWRVSRSHFLRLRASHAANWLQKRSKTRNCALTRAHVQKCN